ncbi:hypothetical protein [Brazilian marseillevirus]|uniref:hypothetical protein n=1 Tax=Brazilian marseillevirus TaxID=1813599 RepID=UPI00078529AE|nr:hypothetical protein A3303_gp092 [Brazilian marseillevirus]AMQ10600.1 hypothetical protein [Brazilian marseillevirus]
MEINSESNTGGDRSEFTVTGIAHAWKKTEKVVLIDACFDMKQREEAGIVEPIYYVSLSHNDAPFLQLRVPITRVYKTEIKGTDVMHVPLRDVVITEADEINVKLLGASGRRIQNPGAWAILFSPIHVPAYGIGNLPISDTNENTQQ